MGKHELNPEQKYRKQKKKQAYENKERERQKNRKILSKKLDKDKIQARIDAIEKEEAAGRMTIGMRQEKSNLTQQLKSITKKSPQNNNAFKKRIPINDPSALKNTQIPQEQNSSSYQDVYPPSSTNEFTNPMTTPTEVGVAPPPPPPVNVPIYNPMAKRSTPLVVSGFDINPSLIPHAAKKHVVPPPPPPLSNPLASSLPVNQIKEEEEEEEEINVPGPKLRFSLFSYGEEDDDNDNKEEEKTEKEKEEDAAFDAFMADIAKL